MKSVYLNKEDCCGCRACCNICAKQAITMKPDEEGFLYPEIDQSLCVDLILVNSPNGTALFDQCRQDLIEEERPKEEAINEQKRLSEPSQLPANRRRFWEDYWRFGFEYVIGKKNKGHEGKNG